MYRILFAVILLTAISCSSSSTSSPGQPSRFANEAIARAHQDAQKAILAPAGSMEREDAILAIHARAHRLNLTGDSATAHVYLTTAIATLDSAGVFTSENQ